LNNKIVSTKKRISAIFLATVLMAGTFAISFPSLMTIDAAQAQPYYGGMDDYGSSDYKIDNDRKSYDNGYESQYPSSYKPNYKPAYPSYGKDDRDKSTKDNKSVDIKKIKCINTNLNINGNNAGNVSIGNKGGLTEEGSVGSYSSGSSGYGYEGYYNGYNNNKKDKGFDCIITNNNNNTNVVAGDAGNVTDGNGNVTEPQTCEECFRAFLTQGQITNLIGTTPLEEHCNSLESLGVDESAFRENLAFAGVSMTNINALIECLINVGIQFSP
jgi:hypothetical protein